MIPIQNAGIVVLMPFFKMLFNYNNLLDEDNFKDERAKIKAIQLLQYLALGATDASRELTIYKILVGMSPDEQLTKFEQLKSVEKKECDMLLTSAIKNWKALKNTSVAGLRTSFLSRPGKLTFRENSWQIRVERKGLDILLDQLPWSISAIQLPWLTYVLYIEW